MFYDVRKPSSACSAFYQSLHSDIACVRFGNSLSTQFKSSARSSRLACSSDEGTVAVFDLTQSDEENALECLFNLDQTIHKIEYKAS